MEGQVTLVESRKNKHDQLDILIYIFQIIKKNDTGEKYSVLWQTTLSYTEDIGGNQKRKAPFRNNVCNSTCSIAMPHSYPFSRTYPTLKIYLKSQKGKRKQGIGMMVTYETQIQNV